LAMCETWITFKGLWHNYIATKGDFKHFKSLRSCFLKVTTKLWCKLFLEVCHYTGLQQLQNTLNRNTIKRLIHTYHAEPMPRPCRAVLTHTFCAVPLPCFDSAMSVTVHVVAGKIWTASPTV
jgi:hypothetical protein